MVDNLSILASNPTTSSPDDDDDRDENEFTVLSINTSSGSIKGLLRTHNDGRIRRIISQVDILTSYANSNNNSDGRQLESNNNTLHLQTVELLQSDREFNCGIDHTDDVEEFHIINRELGDHHHSYHSQHDHHHHHHDHDHHDSNERRKLTNNIFDEEAAFPSSASTNTNQNNNDKKFIINILIAIDPSFITTQSSSTTTSVEYINFLISSVNAVLTPELNIHLNIIKVEEIDILQGVSELREGLKTLRMYYEGIVGSTVVTNNYSDDGTEKETQTIHLVHALLGQDIGGGIAFINTICDSAWGIGLSSGLRGSITNLNEDTFQDIFMIAHEIGHSLGSGHTYDDAYYSPPVDYCTGDTNVCPTSLPMDMSSTIMSYCNFCNGGVRNVAMTFGGVWDGMGDLNDVDSWVRSPQLASESTSVSMDPQRVNHRIYSALVSKGDDDDVCDIRRQTVEEEEEDLSDFPKSLPIPEEAPLTSMPPTKSPSSYFPNVPQEDGRMWTQPDVHCKLQEEQEGISCAYGPGIMFDIELQGIEDGNTTSSSSYWIQLESIQFEHSSSITNNRTIDVYTTIEGSGSYQGNEKLSDQWIKVASSIRIDESTSFTKVELDMPIIISSGTKQGMYLTNSGGYLTNSGGKNFFMIGIIGTSTTTITSSPLSTDDNGVSFHSGSVIFGSDEFGGLYVPGYYPVVQVGYTLIEVPSFSPSNWPSLHPSISMSPSMTPTPVPSSQPSMGPSETPSFQPSKSTYPTSYPSSEPSSAPSTSFEPSIQPSESTSPTETPSYQPSNSFSPSMTPTDLPSNSPTLSPTALPSSSVIPTSSPTISYDPTTGSPTIAPTMSSQLLPLPSSATPHYNEG